MATENQSKPGNTSRTVGIVVVVLLIVVAIAGIVLAGRKEPGPAVAPVSGVATPASTPVAQAAPTADPNEVVFERGSDKLPATATASLAQFAEAARAGNNTVRVVAQFFTGENKAKDLALATARTNAVRHALEANGISGSKMQIELSEMPKGGMTEKDGNRVRLQMQ